MRLRDGEKAPVLLSYVAEDLGAQEGLLYSPEQIRVFFLPRMKRMMDLAHSAGAYVFHHSDGAIRPILPALIEAGIDILNLEERGVGHAEESGLQGAGGLRQETHGRSTPVAATPTRGARATAAALLQLWGGGRGLDLHSGACHNWSGSV